VQTNVRRTGSDQRVRPVNRNFPFVHRKLLVLGWAGRAFYVRKWVVYCYSSAGTMRVILTTIAANNLSVEAVTGV
jgi:hypothetical protein